MSKDNCEKVIAIGHELGFEAGSVLGTAGSENKPEVRSCEAVALNPKQHREIYDFVAQAIRQVNNKQYRFRIEGLEPLQILRYTEGSFFREHSDLGYQYDDAAGRKISLIVQLSADDCYSGGRLVLFGDEAMPKSQGTVCIFPSWLPHRVEPLTAGVRYTLVAWAKGPPFS
jgi:PKHD-type hydroxylase